MKSCKYTKARFKKKNRNTHLKREGDIAVIFIFLLRSGKLAAISEARTKKQPEGPQITLPNQRVSVTIGKRKQTSSICHFGEPTTRVFILVSFAFMQIGKKCGSVTLPGFPKQERLFYLVTGKVHSHPVSFL